MSLWVKGVSNMSQESKDKIVIWKERFSSGTGTVPNQSDEREKVIEIPRNTCDVFIIF